MSLDFANPAAFWLLLLIPVFILLKVFADARARRAVTRLASPRLLDGLLVSQGRGRAWVVFSLELLAFALFAAALARPQYGSVVEESPGSGRSLIIAIDTSKSMKANDILPTRLERAQLAAEDLVKKLRKDRVGLMPFAGTAFMYAPITPDTDALIESIQSLDTDIIPRGGSNISRAIDLAIEIFRKSDLSGQQAMVLFSDGEELEGEAIAAAKRARDARLSIICVGVGKPEGGLIPDPGSPGQFYRDHRTGKIVQTRLHKEVLVKIADLTGGLYLTLDGTGISDSRIDLILAKLQRSAMKSKTIETAVDRYRWPLAAGLLSLTAAFLTGIVRRHRSAVPGSALTAAASVALSFLTIPAPLPAQEDLLPPPEIKADAAKTSEPVESPREAPPKEGDPWKFYREGDYRNSVFNFGLAAANTRNDAALDRLQMGRGAAAFKAATANPEKFDAPMIETAIDSFGVALASGDAAVRENAHYNLGNAIFERAKAAETQRALALAKAKSKKARKKYGLTLKYLDGLIRQLENSLEHYQETLILNKDHKAAQKNHDAVAELVKKLRDIRQKQAQMGEGKGEGEGQGKNKAEGEGEGEGECEGEGQGKGKGKGKGQGSDEEEGEGDDGEEEGEGGGKKEEGEGKGENGEGDKGSGGDESNEEFEGKAGATGETGSADEKGGGDEEEGGDGDGANGGAGEVARNNTIQRLKNLSQELKSRPRSKSMQERRPAKDW